MPIGVLRAPAGALGSIAFDPPVPAIEHAVSLTAMGPVVKLVLRFEHPFWMDRSLAERLRRPGLDQVSFLHSREKLPFSVWWTPYPVRAPLLVGWVGGPPAAKLSALPTNELAAAAVRSLATMFSMAPRSLHRLLISVFYHDWVHDPFARGAYSYSRVGGHRAPEQLAKSVRGTLWFAGEASDHQGTTGTVHGAIASGWRAARQILRLR